MGFRREEERGWGGGAEKSIGTSCTSSRMRSLCLIFHASRCETQHRHYGVGFRQGVCLPLFWGGGTEEDGELGSRWGMFKGANGFLISCFFYSPRILPSILFPIHVLSNLLEREERGCLSEKDLGNEIYISLWMAFVPMGPLVAMADRASVQEMGRERWGVQLSFSFLQHLNYLSIIFHLATSHSIKASPLSISLTEFDERGWRRG